MKKLRIAFVKFGGLSAGGTERFLQTIAAHLPREEFEVDYFYTDSVPYVGSDYRPAGTDPHRQAYMMTHGVRLIRVDVKAKDITRRTHDWLGTNFWQLFHEEAYDLVQTGRAGQPEYPFYQMRRVPIIDSLHLVAGVDNQKNVARVMHLCEWSVRKWVRMGGDRTRVRMVSRPIEIGSFQNKDYRRQLGLEGKFVFGFHQRDDDHIFSPIPLEAFRRIARPSNHFVILGGGQRYREQAKALGLKNITFFPHTADQDEIYSFLSALNVYAHGRKDGEVNSTAMAEALHFGLPIISHYSELSNGHVECIGAAGRVVEDADTYADALLELQENPTFYATLRETAKQQFQENFELHGQMNRIAALYRETVADPFPHPARRAALDLRQRIFPYRVWWMIRNRAIKWLGGNPYR